MRRFNILLVDDDNRLLSAMSTELAKAFDVCTASSGVQALNLMRGQHIDAAVLDIEMPVMTGLDLMPKLKEIQPECRFLFLTCLTDDSTYIRSLNLAPDDFLTKPITSARLEAAIRHRLRRRMEPPQYKFGSLVVDPDSGRVDCGSESISLTRKEQQILLALLQSEDHKIQKGTLTQKIWEDLSVSAHTLDTHITNLRRKLAPAGIQIHIDRDRFVQLSES